MDPFENGRHLYIYSTLHVSIYAGRCLNAYPNENVKGYEFQIATVTLVIKYFALSKLSMVNQERNEW